MRITSISSTDIIFDDGTDIRIEPSDILMQIDPKEREKAMAMEFRYIGFIEQSSRYL